jgi:hypothetical protein
MGMGRPPIVLLANSADVRRPGLVIAVILRSFLCRSRGSRDRRKLLPLARTQIKAGA